MLQRDYYLRIIEEFGKALANFLEKRYDGPRREHKLRDLYRQYVGPYDVLCRLSADETLDYAVREWPDSERLERLAMLAELLYAEAGYSQAPLCTLLYERAYWLYDYVEANGTTYSMDRHRKMEEIKRKLAQKG